MNRQQIIPIVVAAYIAIDTVTKVKATNKNIQLQKETHKLREIAAYQRGAIGYLVDLLDSHDIEIDEFDKIALMSLSIEELHEAH